MRIAVENVGRNKTSWEMDVWDEPRAAAEQIYREVRKRRCLMSSEVDVTWDEGGRSGTVVVGGFRTVGTWRALEAAPESMERRGG